MKLVCRAYLEAADTEKPHVTIAALAAHAEGLIALTGGPDGPIDRALRDRPARGSPRRASTRLKAQLSATASMSSCSATASAGAARSSRSCSISPTRSAFRSSPPTRSTSPRPTTTRRTTRCCASPTAATSCEDDRRRVTREHYFKSADEMAALFADLPEALDNTVEIAQRCAFRPQGRKPDPAALRPGDDAASRGRAIAPEAAELRAPGRGGPARAARRRAARRRLHRGGLRGAARPTSSTSSPR